MHIFLMPVILCICLSKPLCGPPRLSKFVPVFCVQVVCTYLFQYPVLIFNLYSITFDPFFYLGRGRGMYVFGKGSNSVQAVMFVGL